MATSDIFNLTDTWNAGATTFTAIKMNVTDTASASGSLLMDLQVGGSSKFSVSKAGVVTVASSISLIAGNLTLQNGYSIQVAGSNGSIWARDNTAFFAIGTSADTILTRAAAASLQLGAADAAAPVAQTLGVQSVVAGTSNTAGTNFTIKGSAGTGTGAGGSIIFQVAPAGSTGTAQNAFATAMTIDSNKNVTFVGAIFPSEIKNAGGTNTKIDIDYNGVQFSSTAGLGISWSGSSNPSNSKDIGLYRDAAGVLAQRSGTTAQRFRVYNTWTDASNGEWFSIDWQTTANTALVGPTKNGTGTQRVQRLQYLEDGGTGSTTPSLGTTCPAASATVKSWIKVLTSDGTTAYIPCWA
jgi:hypothetical protein